MSNITDYIQNYNNARADYSGENSSYADRVRRDEVGTLIAEADQSLNVSFPIAMLIQYSPTEFWMITIEHPEDIVLVRNGGQIVDFNATGEAVHFTTVDPVENYGNTPGELCILNLLSSLNYHYQNVPIDSVEIHPRITLKNVLERSTVGVSDDMILDYDDVAIPYRRQEILDRSAQDVGDQRWPQYMFDVVSDGARLPNIIEYTNIFGQTVYGTWYSIFNPGHNYPQN